MTGVFSHNALCLLCHRRTYTLTGPSFLPCSIFFVACSNPVDLLFVFDGGNLPIKKNFMKAVIDKFYIGINDTRVTLMLKLRIGEISHPYSYTESANQMKSFIDGLSDVGSAPGVTSGLQRAITALTDVRPEVKQVGFLLLTI